MTEDIDPNTWLQRPQGAEELSKRGLRTTEKMLITARRELPHRINRRCVEIRWEDLLHWRESKIRYVNPSKSAA